MPDSKSDSDYLDLARKTRKKIRETWPDWKKNYDLNEMTTADRVRTSPQEKETK